MSADVVDIRELLRHENSFILLSHSESGVETFLNTLSDIAVIVDKDNLSAVVLDQLSALLADGVGHDNDGTVALYSAHKSKTDALISAGRLNDDGIFFDLAFLFGVFYHIVSGSGLDRASDVQTLKFYQNIGISLFVHILESDKGSMSESFKDIVIYHYDSPL